MKDLTSFTLSLIRKLEEEGRYGTAHVYGSALRAFQKYWEERRPGKAMLMKAAFTFPALREFEQHLRERMLRSNTVSTYMRMLRALYNRALRAGLVKYIPGLFSDVYTGTCADAKRALVPVQMGKVLAAPEQKVEELEMARLWFALLFLLRGMPFADLARLRKCDLQNGEITYRRQKTGRMIRVKVTPEAEALIKRCADRHKGSPYLLDILWDEGRNFRMGGIEEYKRYQAVLRSFNLRLKLLGCILGISSKLSSYTARHTWATTAFHTNCSVGIISNALGHSSVKVTETYLKPFEEEKLDKVNRKIIAYVKRSVES